jgi:putative ABC transport system substrate-binding protein
MRRRAALLALIALGAAPLAARAQPAAKVPTIGIVWNAPLPATQSLQEHLLRGLRAHAYLPGKTIIVDAYSAEGNPARLAALVGDLVRRNVDVIVAPSNAAAKMALDQTKTIPIVMVDVADPVGLGLIASLERPGGNVTGTYTSEPALNARRLELLKQIVPALDAAAVFMTRGNPLAAAHRRDVDMTGRALGMKIDLVEVDAPGELDRAMAAAAKRGARAVFLLSAGGEPRLFAERRRLVKAAARHGLPVAGGRNAGDIGAVISFGPRSEDHYYRSAAFIAKILKGAKPGDLAVEQPTSFELIVNLKAANALGLEVPKALLSRADKVIE